MKFLKYIIQILVICILFSGIMILFLVYCGRTVTNEQIDHLHEDIKVLKEQTNRINNYCFEK